MKEQSTKRNLWQRHWKWLSLLIILMFTIFIMSPVGNSITDIAKVYADSSVYKEALEQVKLNDEVIEVLGDLKSIDAFAIAEGYVAYSNNNSSVNITVRIKGTKGKGKLDIAANRVNGTWEYQTLKIRIKTPKVTIVVLE